jgi:hypothetical protein
VTHEYDLTLGVDEHHMWYTFHTEFFLRFTFGTALVVLNFVPSLLLNSRFYICGAVVDGKTYDADF